MTETTVGGRHFDVLDGWRGVSIVLVLAGHLFPLGRKGLELNAAIATMGMAIFFTLSGFLITSFLLRRPEIGSFLIRRFFRIIPLAWLCSVVVLVLAGSEWRVWMAHLFFYGNLPPFLLLDPTAHFWSLCLEMQFYVGIALLVGALGGRRLALLPILCVAVTLGRLIFQVPISIVTWFRIDEILAGCTLALLVQRHATSRAAHWLGRMPPAALLVGLLAACHPRAEALNYLRPYLASAVVGATLLNSRTWVAGAMRHKALAYLAQVSYALYVLHPLLSHTWLGSGETLARYAKRPLLVAALFAGAHLSTFQYERRFIDWGHRLSNDWGKRRVVA